MFICNKAWKDLVEIVRRSSVNAIQKDEMRGRYNVFREGFRANHELGMPYHFYSALKAVTLAIPVATFVGTLNGSWSNYGLIPGLWMWVFLFGNYECGIVKRIKARTLQELRPSKKEWVLRASISAGSSLLFATINLSLING